MADLIPNCYCFGQEIGSLYWSKNAFQKDVEILHAMDPKKEKDSFEAYRTKIWSRKPNSRNDEELHPENMLPLLSHIDGPFCCRCL